jgi:hypothetical protein
MAKSARNTKPVVTDAGLSTFRALSSHLTGFAEDDLEGTGMVNDYYRVLMQEQDHEGVRAFLSEAESILKLKSDMQIHAELKRVFVESPVAAQQPDPPFDQLSYQGLAQRIILLWYTGIWTTMNGRDTQSQQERTALVSSPAYLEGLIWGTADTHPAGGKQPGFGSWSMRPF